MRRKLLTRMAARRSAADWPGVEAIAQQILKVDAFNEEATFALAEATALSGAKAEAALVDQPANQANFRKAAEAALAGAKPQSQNGFKVELAKRCLKDFVAKDKEHQPIGEPVYNDLVSRSVYREIYWKQGDRGVAFTVPGKTDNEIAGDVGCFYSMTDRGLKFELSQWLHRLDR